MWHLHVKEDAGGVVHQVDEQDVKEPGVDRRYSAGTQRSAATCPVAQIVPPAKWRRLLNTQNFSTVTTLLGQCHTCMEWLRGLTYGQIIQVLVLCAADAHIWQRAVIQGFRACDAFMCGLLRGSHWGGFIAVRVVPVCEVEVGSAWSRRSWRATFRATKRLAIAENIYKSQRDSSLGLFAVCG